MADIAFGSVALVVLFIVNSLLFPYTTGRAWVK